MLYKMCFAAKPFMHMDWLCVLTVCEGNTRCQLINVYSTQKMFIYHKIFFFCELLEWAVQQLRLVIAGAASWTVRKETLLEREVLYLFSMGARSLGELDKGVEKAPREVLKCCYKSLHKKSVMYSTSGFIDQKYKFQTS